MLWLATDDWLFPFLRHDPVYKEKKNFDKLRWYFFKFLRGADILLSFFYPPPLNTSRLSITGDKSFARAPLLTSLYKGDIYARSYSGLTNIIFWRTSEYLPREKSYYLVIILSIGLSHKTTPNNIYTTRERGTGSFELTCATLKNILWKLLDPDGYFFSL